MGDYQKPRCRTGRSKVALGRDARKRRSKVDVEKATDGIFNRLLEKIGRRAHWRADLNLS